MIALNVLEDISTSAILAQVTILLFVSTTMTHGNLLDFAMSVQRPAGVSLGDEAHLSCVLGQGLTLLGDRRCSWQTPDSRTLQVDLVTGEVTNDFGAIWPNYQASGADNDSLCAITIESVGQRDLGEWSCILPGKVFHRGTLYLASEDYVSDVRLPKHIDPYVYELELVPIIEEGNFTVLGKMDLHYTFSPELETDSSYFNQVVLHAKDIAIKEDTVRVTDGLADEEKIVGHGYDLDREFYIVYLENEMSSAELQKSYTISMEFTAWLGDNLVGLYRSQYDDEESGETKNLAATKFEFTNARRAFPCLDEPDMKARFNLKVGHRDTMRAASNMDSLGTLEPMSRLPGYVMEEFRQTDLMSTYLVAILVADFDLTVSSKDENFRIWHRKHKTDQVALAADAGPAILEVLENYLDVPYTLPKLDFAAIPNFSTEAVENWGLVTFCESALLYDPQFSSLVDREATIGAIAHEASHLWFGDLVTPAWWEDMWLHEGNTIFILLLMFNRCLF